MSSSGRRPPAWVRTALVVATWVAAVALATTVAWWAVTAVGGSGDSSAAGILSRSDIQQALADQRSHTATPAPSPSTPTPSAASPTVEPSADPTPVATPTAQPTTPPKTAPPRTTTPPTAAPTVVVRTWDVTGGQVSVSCSGSTISLIRATPSDGWTLTTDHAGPTEVEVTLRRGEDETQVKAVCVGGIPQQDISGGGHGGGDG